MGYSRFKIKNPPAVVDCLERRTRPHHAAKARRRVGTANWEINSTDIGFSQHNVVRFRSPEYATLELRKRGRIRGAGKILVDATLKDVVVRRGPREQGHGRAEFHLVDRTEDVARACPPRRA